MGGCISDRNGARYGRIGLEWKRGFRLYLYLPHTRRARLWNCVRFRILHSPSIATFAKSCIFAAFLERFSKGPIRCKTLSRTTHPIWRFRCPGRGAESGFGRLGVLLGKTRRFRKKCFWATHFSKSVRLSRPKTYHHQDTASRKESDSSRQARRWHDRLPKRFSSVTLEADFATKRIRKGMNFYVDSLGEWVEIISVVSNRSYGRIHRGLDDENNILCLNSEHGQGDIITCKPIRIGMSARTKLSNLF